MGRNSANRPLRRTLFENDYNFIQHFNRLKSLAISSYKWEGMPDTIDVRFMELTLFSMGMAVFFKDEILDRYLCLPCKINEPLDVYNIPRRRTAYANNGYNYDLDDTNSVLIFNNMLHEPDADICEQFAMRLYELDSTIDINCHAQKTPILIRCAENQRLTIENMYAKYDGNMPVIFGDKNSLDPDAIKVLTTGAPFIAGNVMEIKNSVWNEVLTYLGISNMSVTKSERLITDEVQRSMGGVFANRYSRLSERQEACKRINEMFGLDVSVEFRENVEPQGNPGDEDSRFNLEVNQ